jgi:hypothetical protein
MSGALRFNEGKPKLGYFMRSFRRALEAVARVKEFGANKYNEGNWKKGGKPDEEYLDSMCRHLDYYLGGEVYDQDSGCHHLGHAIWNLCAWMELNTTGPLIDKEVFYARMAYWAAEKAKREAKLEPVGEIYVNGAKLADVDSMTIEFQSTPVPLLKDTHCPLCGSEIVWETDFGKECECGHVFDLLVCPQCDETNCISLEDGGFECPDCGEIFGLPIVPADGEGDVYIEEIIVPENNVQFYLLSMPQDNELRDRINDIVQALVDGATLPQEDQS